MANERLLSEALRQQPTPEMLGTGAASAAGTAVGKKGSAYKMYAAEKMAMGETPMSYEEWLKGQ